ncbi:MAG: hypothetical protein WHV63_06205 [Ignavibacteria bacterium]|jgi:hypothetical protein|nr:hypothetical protein [Ignavibacteria bacterium]MDH7527433.1 hypothetical protein [Ignavibacteria bacterium]
MKKVLTILLIGLTTLVFAGATLEFFRGRSENDKVILEWKSREEAAVKEYIIERKSLNSDYIPLATVQPKGNNSYYSFIDETAFKSLGSIYYYRLKIVDYNGSISYSNEISIFHSVSSVKRTWGSIKAMFR